MIVLLWLMLISPGESPCIVYLIRHAEKDVLNNEDPGLTETGKLRSVRLAHFFDKIEFDQIISSPFNRTRQTAAPIAQSKDIQITILPPQDYEAIATRVMRQGKVSLVVAHSNTIPAIIEKLGCTSTPIEESDYDRLYLLVIGGSGCRMQRFQFELP